MSDSSKDGLLAVCGTMTILSGIAVALRFYVRKRQSAPILSDEIFALLAWIVNIASVICVFLLVHWKALGYSSSQIDPEQAAKTAKRAGQVELAYSVFRPLSLACIKLSALCFYRRIFCVGHTRQWFTRTINISIVVVVLWLVVFEFLTGFECGTHVSALWNKAEYVKYCTIVFPFLYGLAISDLLLDIWILALPIPRVMRLNASLKQRLSIVGVFLLSYIGLAASIGRVVVYAAIEDGGPTYFATHDEELALTRTFFFDMLEAGMTLIAVNLPSLWPLASQASLREIWQSVRSFNSYHRSESGDKDMTDANGPGHVEAGPEKSSWRSSAVPLKPVNFTQPDGGARNKGPYDSHSAHQQQWGETPGNTIQVLKSVHVERE